MRVYKTFSNLSRYISKISSFNFMEDFSSKDALRIFFKVNLMLELKGNNFTHTLRYITLNHLIVKGVNSPKKYMYNVIESCFNASYIYKCFHLSSVVLTHICQQIIYM